VTSNSEAEFGLPAQQVVETVEIVQTEAAWQNFVVGLPGKNPFVELVQK
jgi:hypothetical protein